jgi:nucleotide-binding universal stress UspA family protein
VDAEVAVVHAVGMLEHAGHPGDTGAIEQAVQRLVTDAGFDPGRVRWCPADGDPCSVLLRATAAPLAADLLVVGSRWQGARAGLLLGSTSHELAEHATVPLVIVPKP